MRIAAVFFLLISAASATEYSVEEIYEFRSTGKGSISFISQFGNKHIISAFEIDRTSERPGRPNECMIFLSTDESRIYKTSNMTCDAVIQTAESTVNKFRYDKGLQ